jgi:general secretion pathway protein G
MRRIVGLIAVGFVVWVALDVFPRWHWARVDEGVKAVRVQIEMLGTALDTFRCDVGRYPTGDEGLRALRERPPGLAAWDGPYLRKDAPNDPWNRPFIYRSAGDGYELSSLGADGRPGGRGDDLDEVGTPEPWSDDAQRRRSRCGEAA